MDFILTEVLTRIKIDSLNPMQQEMWAVGDKTNDMILLSPTGSGKTLLAKTLAKFLFGMVVVQMEKVY